MGLVTGIVHTVQIPHDPDHSAVIRKLSHKQLKKAARVRQKEGVGDMKEIGAELIKALRDDNADKVRQIEETQAANPNNYDRDTILKLGLADWSYEAALPDGTDDLDEPTAAFLHEQIFRFSRPETQAERKND